MDTDTEWTYASTTQLFELELSKVRSKQKGNRRHKSKSWWDGDIERTTEKRQEASREHRYSKRNNEPEVEVENGINSLKVGGRHPA